MQKPRSGKPNGSAWKFAGRASISDRPSTALTNARTLGAQLQTRTHWGGLR